MYKTYMYPKETKDLYKWKACPILEKVNSAIITSPSVNLELSV